MRFIATYGAALIAFVIMDAAWLTLMGNRLYRATLGDILLPSIKPAAAVCFYLLFPVGITVFAALPSAREGSFGLALVLGLLLGAIAYATYDLTNLATLRNWTVQLAVIDIVYGAVVTGLSALAGAAVAHALAN